MRPASIAFGLVFALLMTAPPVFAQAQSEKAQAAWKMAEGKRAMAKGDLDAAIAAYEAAHVILKQPDSGAPLARALAKKGRLADALAVARAVAQSPKAGKEAFSVTTARSDADKLAAELEKKVPKLRVEAPEGASITIDGRDVPSEGGVRRVDPGDHKVEGKHDGKTASMDVKLAEGDDKSVKLDFGGGTGAGAAAPKPDAGPNTGEPKDDGPAPPVKGPAEESEGKGNPAAATAAIVGFSAFAAGAGLGLGAFFASQSRLDDLDATCGGDCAGSLAREENDANAIRIFAFAGFGLAGAGLVTGIVGAAVAGTASSSDSASIQPEIGPGYAGVRGRF